VLPQTPETSQEPELQVARREPKNPELQTGTQVDPEGTPETQSPKPALTKFGKPVQVDPVVLAQPPVVVQTPR
jgi:hypothetical protein